MAALPVYGTNKMRDGSVSSLGQGAVNWYQFTPANANDGVVSGTLSSIRYGLTASAGASVNNGVGLSITFTSALSLRAMKIYGYNDVVDATIQYYNGSSWVTLVTAPLTADVADANSGVTVEFNNSGAVASDKWRWISANYNNYSANNNYYSWEVECYTENSSTVATLTGSIAESLAVTDFSVYAVDCLTKQVVASVIATGDTYSIAGLPKSRGYFITAVPEYQQWKASTVYALDAKVFPPDPVATPYYYKRLAAGTSGATEPTWPIIPGGRCNDGAVTDAWELVERLIQPITHGPLIPS